MSTLRLLPSVRPLASVLRHALRPCSRQPGVMNVTRRYMSENNSAPSPTPETKKQDNDKPSSPVHAMLKATLPFVNEHGWSMDSLMLGAQSLGYPSVAHGLIADGESGLVDEFLKDYRRQFIALIEEKLASDEVKGLSIDGKVQLFTAMRIQMMQPFIKRWPDALAVMARPSNIPMSLKHLGDIADDIWYYAGDRSPDMNWYTKRASLATIYSATELYMTQDVSTNYTETYRFLNRRLDQAKLVDASARQLCTMLAFGARSFVGALSTRGNRVL
ncbi:Ubiquinone biosynthesis protein coq9, mitochondrial [Apophysomyces ossiformis]|uniref:Ubiquinone biosynthesis protein n=1 Tax=Apophysomyces ossiformis TaxID=679940 RepID=A0A8H7BYG3_9FUNG|nr:Ubiquinone biosynthesis protein coq9, mitochondrial [Apophysomyces ossiformis]